MKRQFDPSQPELMDVQERVTPEFERDLLQLRRLNRYFGSYRLIRCFLKAWMKGDRSYRLLDLATGSGDIPRLIVDWARARKIPVRIDAVDANPAAIEIARGLSGNYPEITFIKGDARTYIDAQTYDIVCCSLALHHFSEQDAVKVLRQMVSLSHDRVLVADLERNYFTWLCVRFVTATVFRDPMTKNDGRASVQRAFSCAELAELAQRAGWQHFGQQRFIPARQAIWMCVREEAPAIDFRMPAPDFAT